MVPLKAIKPFDFAGKQLAVGASFAAVERDAQTLVAIGYAEPAVAEMTTEDFERIATIFDRQVEKPMDATIAEEAKPRRLRGPDKKPRKNRYKRRDMVAD